MRTDAIAGECPELISLVVVRYALRQGPLLQKGRRKQYYCSRNIILHRRNFSVRLAAIAPGRGKTNIGELPKP